MWETSTLRTLANEDLGTLAEYDSLTSSAWTITSGRRWVDRILETEKMIFGTNLSTRHWSDDMWKSNMAGGGANKKRSQCCTDPAGQRILYLRALQGHSGQTH